MESIQFTKMHGAGNDFVLLDAITEPALAGLPFATLAPSMCARQTGIGADGLLLLERGDSASLRMRMFNPDGSEAEMCGNGLRCLARYALDHGYAQSSSFSIETAAGTRSVEAAPEQPLSIWMGRPSPNVPVDIDYARRVDKYTLAITIDGQEYKLICLSMGNPHAVLFVPDVSVVDIATLGPAIEHHPAFPERINIMFTQPSEPGIRVRPWERGAGATFACGSGACAAALASRLHGIVAETQPVSVAMPGGNLSVSGDWQQGVWLSGPVVTVYSGRYNHMSTKH